MTASTEPSARIIVVAALATGLMLWAAAPAVGAGWLAWVALVPVAAVVLVSPVGRAARLTVPLAYVVYLELLVAPAFPFGLAEGQWGEPVIPVLVDDSPVLAIALVAVPLVGVILYALRFGQPWGAWRLRGSLATAAAVAVPALAWTALDFARAKLDPGALWGPLFLSQADTPAGSLAALGGPWLITLAIVAVNYGIAAALVRRRPLPALVPVAGAIALALAGAAVEGRDAGAGELRVGAVQPGYDTAESERPELRHFAPGTYDLAALDVIRDLAELTREATGAGAELVVWPEAAMYVDPREEPPVRRALAKLVRETGVPLVVPFFRPRPAGQSQVVAIVPSPRGPRFTDVRPKHRPLWFIGERRAAGEEGPVAVEGREVGALLGVDVQDARNAAALGALGAELLVSATHDWRQSAVPARAYARLASRASGLPLVRADWRYGSAIYGRDGAALDEVDGGVARATVVASVELASSPAPYARLGDAVGWLAVAGVGLAALIALASRLSLGGPLNRAGGPGGGGRAPRRGSTPPPPSPARPRAGAGPKPPPP
jgi:apolipoprotein N-acyltransferase